jgi:hypothetical protein
MSKKTPAIKATTTSTDTKVAVAANGKSKKEFFDMYKAADDKVNAAKAALEAALKERSDTVEEIFNNFGSGPFAYGGQALQAIKRGLKDEAGVVIGSTWFFKSLGKREIQVVE